MSIINNIVNKFCVILKNKYKQIYASLQDKYNKIIHPFESKKNTYKS